MIVLLAGALRSTQIAGSSASPPAGTGSVSAAGEAVVESDARRDSEPWPQLASTMAPAIAATSIRAIQVLKLTAAANRSAKTRSNRTRQGRGWVRASTPGSEPAAVTSGAAAIPHRYAIERSGGP